MGFISDRNMDICSADITILGSAGGRFRISNAIIKQDILRGLKGGDILSIKNLGYFIVEGIPTYMYNADQSKAWDRTLYTLKIWCREIG